jgi:hypothetical protein
MVDDRDGLARMGAGDLLKGSGHAGDDLMPRVITRLTSLR